MGWRGVLGPRAQIVASQPGGAYLGKVLSDPREPGRRLVAQVKPFLATCCRLRTPRQSFMSPATMIARSGVQ